MPFSFFQRSHVGSKQNYKIYDLEMETKAMEANNSHKAFMKEINWSRGDASCQLSSSTSDGMSVINVSLIFLFKCIADTVWLFFPQRIRETNALADSLRFTVCRVLTRSQCCMENDTFSIWAFRLMHTWATCRHLQKHKRLYCRHRRRHVINE